MKQSLPGLARCQISTIQRVVSDSQKVDAAKWASRLSSPKNLFIPLSSFYRLRLRAAGIGFARGFVFSTSLSYEEVLR